MKPVHGLSRNVNLRIYIYFFAHDNLQLFLNHFIKKSLAFFKCQGTFNLVDRLQNIQIRLIPNCRV
jgi:hypothetical protein